MPIKTPLIIEIDNRTWLVNEFGLTTIYALCGRDRGLIINTGSGNIDLEGIVNRLFKGLPYDIIITSPVKTHIMGLFYMNKIGYVSEKDSTSIQEIKCEKKELQTGYVSPFNKKPIWSSLNMNIIEEKCSFDLGLRKVEVITTPGTFRGGISLYDSNTNILFSGDLFNEMVEPKVSYSEMLVNLLRLRELNITRIYPSNFPICDYRSYNKTIIDDTIGLLRVALHKISKDKIIKYGQVSLIYDESKCFEEYEHHSPYPLGM